MAIERFIIFALVASTLVSTSSATSGQATYYTTYVPSACYGYDSQGTLIAAANPTIYNNGAACGTTYTIQCTGGTNQGDPQPCIDGSSVEVTIVDLCPGCNDDQFDLSQEVFSVIANVDAGRINIDYALN